MPIFDLSASTKKYKALQAFILKRQQFEAEHPFPPYNEYKTDINFSDKQGNTLLHYAAMMGDIDKIRDCIEGGANLNLKNGEGDTAIVLALINDKFMAADFLLDSKADCASISFDECLNETQEAWFKEKIVSHSSQFITKQNTAKRAAEMGDLELMKSINVSATDSDSVLITAAANNQLEIVAYLLEKKIGINGSEPFCNTALMQAIISHHENMVKYLLSKDADIHKENELRRTAFMIAVMHNNRVAFDLLLEKKCDLHHFDVDGNTVLHLAVNKKSIFIKELLLIPEIKTLVNLKNSYGDTPLDLAYRCKNDLAINVLAPDMLSFKESPNYGHKHIRIAQDNVMKSMKYRLQLHYRSTEYFSDKGHCNGFAFLRSVYASQGMSQYYYDTLALMSNWDGDESTLFKPFSGIKQADYYKNLDELFEQWTNDITWFQHTKLNRVDSIKLSDRVRQYHLVKDKQDHACYMLNEEGETLVLDANFNKWQPRVRELMLYLMKMPKHVHFEIANSKHVTSAYINAQGHFDYYDPNFLYPAESTQDIDINVKRIIDYLYIFLSSEIKAFTNNYFQIKLLCFKKNFHLLHFDQFEIFNTLPTSKQEVIQFQKDSPNQFTPLHVAFITRSLPCIKQLLLDGYCDLSARDANRRTALDIALKHKFYEGIVLFINYSGMSVSDIYDLCSKNRFAFNDHVIPNVSDSVIAALFFKAIDKNDVTLIKTICEKGLIDLNKDYSGEMALHYAITNQKADACNILLEMGASVDVQNAEGKSVIDLVNESDDEQIKALFAENNLLTTHFRM